MRGTRLEVEMQKDERELKFITVKSVVYSLVIILLALFLTKNSWTHGTPDVPAR